MSSIHPTRLLRFNLYLILLGLATNSSIQGLSDASHGFSAWDSALHLPRLIVTAAFLILMMSYFHAQIIFFENEEHNAVLIERSGRAAADLFLNLATVMSLVVISQLLSTPLLFLGGNVVLRLIDSLLILSVRQRVRHGKGEGETAIPDALRYWLWVVAVFLVVFTSLLFALRHSHSWNVGWADLRIANPHWTGLIVSSSILGLILLSAVLDYLINNRLYFPGAGDWGKIANIFNDQHGELGTKMENDHLYPEIRRQILDGLQIQPPGTNKALAEKKVLVAACGNGFVARQLSRDGASVTAVDKYPEMIAKAETYSRNAGDGEISYRQFDVLARPSLDDAKTLGKEFDIVIAPLLAMYIDNPAVLFERMKAFVKPDGMMIAVLLTKEGMKNDECCSSEIVGGKQICTFKEGNNTYVTRRRFWSRKAIDDSVRKAYANPIFEHGWIHLQHEIVNNYVLVVLNKRSSSMRSPVDSVQSLP